MGWTARDRQYRYRRNLPHIQKDCRALFVTFHAYGSLELPPAARDIVLETCLREHKHRIDLHAVVVMPTHMHLLFSPLLDEANAPYTIAQVMNAIKSVSAHRINRALIRTGHVWQDESFDHVLRREEKLEAAILYLMQNPVSAGLVKNPTEYKWLWRKGVDDVGSGDK